MTDARQIRSAYDEWHERVSATAALDTPWHRLVQEALHLDRDLGGRQVLEIACGRGEFALWCVSQSAPSAFVAADFSIGAVRLARRRLEGAGRAVQFVQADAQAIALPSNSMDTVICCETIEHVHRPARGALRSSHGFLGLAGDCSLQRRTTWARLARIEATCVSSAGDSPKKGSRLTDFLLAPRVRRWVRPPDCTSCSAIVPGHYLPFPRRPPILLVDRIRGLTPFGLHALTVAEKPR